MTGHLGNLLAAAPPEAGERAVSLAEAFFLQRSGRTGSIEWFGTLLIWVLIAASLASIALIIARARETRRASIAPRDAMHEAKRLLREGQLVRARSAAEKDGSLFSRALHAALREAEGGQDASLRALEQACDELAAQRLRRIEPLSVIGGVAPMMGLFGTVYGMILAFREIVAAGGAPEPVGLAAGIGTALTTTFWGLVVAIPALAGFGALRVGIDALVSEAALEAEDAIVGYFTAGKGGAGARSGAA